MLTFLLHCTAPKSCVILLPFLNTRKTLTNFFKLCLPEPLHMKAGSNVSIKPYGP